MLWAPDIGLMLIPIVFFGLGHGVLIPSLQTMMTETAPLQYRAGVLSLNGMVLRLGQTLGPVLMSLVFSLFQLNGVLAIGAALAFLIFGLCLVIWR